MNTVMAMLPNDHHPSARCSCAHCLRQWPDPATTAMDAALATADQLRAIDMVQASLQRGLVSFITRRTTYSKSYRDDYGNTWWVEYTFTAGTPRVDLGEHGIDQGTAAQAELVRVSIGGVDVPLAGLSALFIEVLEDFCKEQGE